MPLTFSSPAPSAAPAQSNPARSDDRSQARLQASPRVQKLIDGYFKYTFNLRVRAEFYAAMADAAEAGIAPYGTLEDMVVVARRRVLKRDRVHVLLDVMETVGKGAGLPRALAPWIPAQEAVTLLGAEQAGPKVVIGAMQELSALLERQAKARAQLLRTLGSAVFILGTIVAVMAVVVANLVPAVQVSLVPGAEAKMPFAAVYFHIAGWLMHHGLWVAAPLVALIAGSLVALPLWTGRVRRWFDLHVPPFTLYQRLQATLFLSSTAAMMRAGITLNSVLADTAGMGSRWLRANVQRMRDVLTSGQGEIAALAVGPLPASTADTLQIYRRIPRFQDVMTRLASANFAAYERAIARVSVLVTYGAMFLAVGFGVATVISMFQFSDAIKASASAFGH